MTLEDLRARLTALQYELTLLALDAAFPEGILRWRIKIAAEKAERLASLVVGCECLEKAMSQKSCKEYD